MIAIRILLIVLVVSFVLSQIVLPLILNLPCFWCFSRAKRAQVNFAFRVAGSENPKKTK